MHVKLLCKNDKCEKHCINKTELNWILHEVFSLPRLLLTSTLWPDEGNLFMQRCFETTCIVQKCLECGVPGNKCSSETLESLMKSLFSRIFETILTPFWSLRLGECDDMAQEIPQTIEFNFTMGSKYITLSNYQPGIHSPPITAPTITHHKTQAANHNYNKHTVQKSSASMHFTRLWVIRKWVYGSSSRLLCVIVVLL